MSKSIIRMGDVTSHGGTVITGDLTWTIYGKAVARVGDLTVCPQCKGQFAITEGADDTTALGQAVARQGDKTACGAILIASQSSAYWNKTTSAQESAALPQSTILATASKAIAQEAPTICLECLAAAAAAGTAMVVRS